MTSVASLDDPGLGRRSIRRKLDRLVILSVGVSLACVSVLDLWNEADRYLTSKRDVLLATAQVFGAAASKAVAQGDADAVVQGLRGVARIPGLESAEVRDANGRSLASLGSSVRLAADADFSGQQGPLLQMLTSRSVRVTVPVVDGGQTVGSLSLVSATDGLAGRFGRAMAGAAAGFAIAIGLGLVLSRRLQRSITRPLVSLAAAMARFGQSETLARVEIATDDETGLLASRFNTMMDEIERATDELLSREGEIIARLARAGEQRDDQTGEHVVRVAKISRLIADGLGLDGAFTDDLCRASPMHDVGKISVPDAILFKPGKLDASERQEMERHAEAGYQVLAGSQAKLVQLAAEIAISHHERWDGAGYPRRLAGEQIPLSGRITAVADVCDALLSKRPYKEPWTLDAVRDHLAENAGSHFDPACVAALLSSWSALEQVYGVQADMDDAPRAITSKAASDRHPASDACAA